MSLKNVRGVWQERKGLGDDWLIDLDMSNFFFLPLLRKMSKS